MHKNCIAKKKPVKTGVLFLFEPSKTSNLLIFKPILVCLKIDQIKFRAQYCAGSGLNL